MYALFPANAHHDLVNSNNDDDDANEEENKGKLNQECLNCSGDQTKLGSTTTSPLKENNTTCNSFLNMDNSVSEVQRENFNNEKASTSGPHAPKIEDLCCDTNNILCQENSTSVLIEAEALDY